MWESKTVKQIEVEGILEKFRNNDLLANFLDTEEDFVSLLSQLSLATFLDKESLIDAVNELSSRFKTYMNFSDFFMELSVYIRNIQMKENINNHMLNSIIFGEGLSNDFFPEQLTNTIRIDPQYRGIEKEQTFLALIKLIT